MEKLFKERQQKFYELMAIHNSLSPIEKEELIRTIILDVAHNCKFTVKKFESEVKDVKNYYRRNKEQTT